MQVCSKKKFFAVITIMVVMGILAVSLTTWSFEIIMPIQRFRFYQQLVNFGHNDSYGKLQACVKLNHTIIVSSNAPEIESILVIIQNSDYFPDVHIAIRFGSLIPRLISGNDSIVEVMYANQTRTLCTRLFFDTDGTYVLDSEALAFSLSDGSYEGVFGRYYITVAEGRITQVADRNELAMSPYLESESI